MTVGKSGLIMRIVNERICELNVCKEFLMSKIPGRQNWIFPDCELPPSGDFPLKGHESVIVLNPGLEKAEILLTFYFTDKHPIQNINVSVEAERVRCFRMDKPEEIGGVVIPRETQYALSLKSSVPVVVQYGRLDTRDQPMAFYINTGYFE